MQSDLLRIVEALYAVEQPRELWIAGVQAAASEVLSAPAGVGSVFYDVSGEAIVVEAIHAFGISDEMLASARDDHVNPDYADRIHHFYRSVMCAPQEVYVGDDPRFRARMASYRVRDSILVNGLDPSGTGVAIFLFSREHVGWGEQQALAFERLAVHIASSYRLQRRLHQLDQPALDSASAIFDSRGKLEDMRKPLARNHVDELKRALHGREWARGPARTEQPRQALARWKALVQGRWSLVDHFERDGKRYILAQENSPHANGSSKMSEREQQVANLAALGRSNKVIAYELGIAHSTVRVLLGRACARMGASTRSELIEKLSRRTPAYSGGRLD